MTGFFGILPRYVLRLVMLPTLCSFLGFLFIFLIGDMQDKLGDMLKLGDSTAVVIYFACILPEKFEVILPMSLLLGTMYCFAGMNRNNEITAIRASGVSLLKLCLPILLFALFLSGLTFLSNEKLLPSSRAISEKIRLRAEGDDTDKQLRHFSVKDKSGHRRKWSLSPGSGPRSFGFLIVSEIDEKGHLLWDVTAQKGEYFGSRWRFDQVERVEYLPGPAIKRSEQLDSLFLDVGDDPSAPTLNSQLETRLSINQIDAILANPAASITPRQQTELIAMRWNNIFSPFACLVAILLGIPLAVTAQRQVALAATAKALAVMMIYYVVRELSMHLSINGKLPPELGAALPVLTFVSLGLIISARK
ncbi:MAG: hypothetical protein RL095_1022 [Verrucomicrobiota bacterium]|jgi:lipopolysaccharide export system permease protein